MSSYAQEFDRQYSWRVVPPSTCESVLRFSTKIEAEAWAKLAQKRAHKQGVLRSYIVEHVELGLEDESHTE